MKNISENTKVTLTVEQLKKLIKESKDSVSSVDAKTIRTFVENFFAELLSHITQQIEESPYQAEDGVKMLAGIYRLLEQIKSDTAEHGYNTYDLTKILDKWRVYGLWDVEDEHPIADDSEDQL